VPLLPSSRPAAIALAILAGCTGTVPPPVPAAACRPPDALTARTLTRLRELATSTDSLEGASRDSLRLRPVPAQQVVLVQHGPACAQAVAALNRALATPGAARTPYVYAFGPWFLAEDPAVGGGEYRDLRIYDQQWTYVATMATF